MKKPKKVSIKDKIFVCMFCKRYNLSSCELLIIILKFGFLGFYDREEITTYEAVSFVV
jgi:hypothetical protein